MEKAAAQLGCSNAQVIPLMWGSGNKDEFAEMQTAIEHSGPDAAPYPPELDRLMDPARYIGRCPQQVRALLDRIAPLLKDARSADGGVSL